MGRIGNVLSAPLIRFACIVIGCVLAIGCSESKVGGDTKDGPFVRVLYQDQPLADVQIQLHENRGGPVLAQSISRHNGNAYFSEVPSPEPAQYYVTLQSLSDGGWILDAEASRKISQSISLNTLESSPGQEIVIPDGAVKPLSSIKQR